MLVKRYGVLTELQRWGTAPLVRRPSDFVHEIHQDVAVGFGSITDAFTLVVDLTQTQDAILSGFTKDTRTEIRRAQKTDGLIHRMHERDGIRIDEFLSDYHAFAQLRKMPVMANRIISIYREQGGMILTTMHGGVDGPVLSWHSYMRAGHSIILLHSFGGAAAKESSSAQRGRANRLHHWLDMVAFKDAGFESYDFGGWYPYLDSPELLNVNRFKEEFGGSLVRKVSIRRAVSLRGKLALLILSVLNKVRRDRRELASSARALKSG